jgi:hypothetical protein
MGAIAEMLGDRECRQPGSPPGARRLIHLTKDKRRPCQNAGLFKFDP